MTSSESSESESLETNKSKSWENCESLENSGNESLENSERLKKVKVKVPQMSRAREYRGESSIPALPFLSPEWDSQSFKTFSFLLWNLVFLE